MNLLFAGTIALVAQILGDVVALEGAVLPGEQIHAAELVAAGLDHETQRDAGTLRFGAFRRRRHLHLLIGVVVAEKLVPDDAVELDQLLSAAAVVARAGGRGSADGVAADVELRRREAGHQAGQAANAAAVRQVVHLLVVPVDADGRRLQVDDRRVADDGDLLGQRVDPHRAVDGHRRADFDADAVDVQRLEPGQLELTRYSPTGSCVKR